MMKNDRLGDLRPPILEKDLGAVFGCDECHGLGSLFSRGGRYRGLRHSTCSQVHCDCCQARGGCPTKRVNTLVKCDCDPNPTDSAMSTMDVFCLASIS